MGRVAWSPRGGSALIAELIPLGAGIEATACMRGGVAAANHWAVIFRAGRAARNAANGTGDQGDCALIPTH